MVVEGGVICSREVSANSRCLLSIHGSKGLAQIQREGVDLAEIGVRGKPL